MNKNHIATVALILVLVALVVLKSKDGFTLGGWLKRMGNKRPRLMLSVRILSFVII